MMKEDVMVIKVYGMRYDGSLPYSGVNIRTRETVKEIRNIIKKAGRSHDILIIPIYSGIDVERCCFEENNAIALEITASKSEKKGEIKKISEALRENFIIC